MTMPTEEVTLRDGRVHVFAFASDGEQEADSPLAIEPGTVDAQVAGESFDATLATTSGGGAEQTAVINWGDESPVSPTTVAENAVAENAVAGEHTYTMAGTYTVSVTVDDGVRSASTTLEILVEEPVPPYSPEIAVDPLEAAPGATVCR